jgi:YfiH family protein
MTHPTAPAFEPGIANTLPIYRIRAFEPYADRLTHAIFTRNGGVSDGPFRSLNLSLSVGDDEAMVAANTGLMCRALGLTPAQTVACYLEHGAKVLTVTPANRQPVMGFADGLITATPGIYLYMRYGDCTPLIFFDPVRRAVGLAHAGWRGTMQNMAGAAVSAMVAQLGSNPADIIAAIGPAIGPCCYEVGAEVMSAAAIAFTEADSLFRRNGRPDHAHFDMGEANRRQLAEAGVTQIIQSGLCTACRTAEFFSHRAEKGQTGRFGVIIGLKEAAL